MKIFMKIIVAFDLVIVGYALFGTGLHNIDVDYNAHRWAVLYSNDYYMTERCDAVPFNLSCIKYGHLYLGGIGLVYFGVGMLSIGFLTLGQCLKFSEYIEKDISELKTKVEDILNVERNKIYGKTP